MKRFLRKSVPRVPNSLWILGLTLILDVAQTVAVIGAVIQMVGSDLDETFRYLLISMCFAGMIRALVWLDEILYPDE